MTKNLKIINELFERVVHNYAEEDIYRMADMFDSLERYGLKKLCERFGSENKIDNFMATLTEIIVTAEIIKLHSNIKIDYEPDNGIPDLRINFDNTIYNIQFKKEGKLEKDNRLDKQINSISSALEKIKIIKFYDLELPAYLTDDLLIEFLEFVDSKSRNHVNKEKYFFEKNGIKLASVKFYNPANKIISLTLGGWKNFIDNQIDIRPVTGKIEQIKQSLMKALKGFKDQQNEKLINLIVIENSDDIDLGRACFGEEIFIANRRPTRDISGFFYDNFLISGIIGIKRNWSFLQSKTFFVNPNCRKFSGLVSSLFLPNNTYYGQEYIP